MSEYTAQQQLYSHTTWFFISILCYTYITFVVKIYFGYKLFLLHFDRCIHFFQQFFWLSYYVSIRLLSPGWCMRARQKKITDVQQTWMEFCCIISYSTRSQKLCNRNHSWPQSNFKIVHALDLVGVCVLFHGLRK